MTTTTHTPKRDDQTIMYELTSTFEPTRSRAFITRKSGAGTTSPDSTRSRRAKARSVELRKMRGGRKGGR